MRERFYISYWVQAAIVFLTVGAAHSIAQAVTSAPTLEAVQAGVIAKGVLLYDPQAQKVVWARDPDGRYAPASTTKLMTSLMVMEKNGLGGAFTVSERDTWVEPSHVPLVAGETVRVKDLVSALLIGSDNDCAMALGRNIGGDLPTFITMMNQKARALGCRNTNFVNPNGLPAAGQYTSANDLLTIFQNVIAIPELRRICETPYYDLRTETGFQRLKNHNKLLGVYPGMGPAKTGWTVSSQHTYAASCTRNGRELQLIILKSTNKWADSKLLFDYGFSHLPPVRKQRDDSLAATRPAPVQPAPLTGPVAQPASVSQVGISSAPVVEMSSGSMPTEDNPREGSAAAAPERSIEVISYVVRKGDTLSSISRRFSSSVERIQHSNPEVDPMKLVPGTVLHIPKASDGDA